MKIRLRHSILFLLSTLSSAQALASGVIVQVTDPSQVVDILDDYPAIIGVQQAGHSPFVRFEITDEYTDGFEDLLELDHRIVWARDEPILDRGTGHSSHGSSVAAIFSRMLTFPSNPEAAAQIRFTSNRRGKSVIRVGIVDTGLSIRQPLLQRQVVAKASFVDASPTVDDAPTGLDSNRNGIFDEGAGHGTVMAGVIAQFAPDSPLVIAKSADSDGNGTPWSVLQGVVYCVENRAKVINLSLGSAQELTGFDEFLPWVESSGSVIVSPIGNGNVNSSLFPAAYPSVICVVGLLPDNVKAPFSNWSAAARVAAPATGINVSLGDAGLSTWSGTSLAAPLVSGCIAAALTDAPGRTPAEIRLALTTSGVNIDDINPSFRGQIGRLLNFEHLYKVLRSQ